MATFKHFTVRDLAHNHLKWHEVLGTGRFVTWMGAQRTAGRLEVALQPPKATVPGEFVTGLLFGPGAAQDTGAVLLSPGTSLSLKESGQPRFDRVFVRLLPEDNLGKLGTVDSPTYTVEGQGLTLWDSRPRIAADGYGPGYALGAEHDANPDALAGTLVLSDGPVFVQPEPRRRSIEIPALPSTASTRTAVAMRINQTAGGQVELLNPRHLLTEYELRQYGRIRLHVASCPATTAAINRTAAISARQVPSVIMPLGGHNEPGSGDVYSGTFFFGHDVDVTGLNWVRALIDPAVPPSLYLPRRGLSSAAATALVMGAAAQAVDKWNVFATWILDGEDCARRPVAEGSASIPAVDGVITGRYDVVAPSSGRDSLTWATEAPAITAGAGTAHTFDAGKNNAVIGASAGVALATTNAAMATGSWPGGGSVRLTTLAGAAGFTVSTGGRYAVR